MTFNRGDNVHLAADPTGVGTVERLTAGMTYIRWLSGRATWELNKDVLPVESNPAASQAAYDEAMSAVQLVHGPISAREREIAETAARAVYRRASREIVELLQECVRDA